MRRWGLVAVLVLASCGSSEVVLTPTTAATGSPVCDPTVASALNGVSAVTRNGTVRVWTGVGTADFVEFVGLGDEPDNRSTEGDSTFVESVAVVPETCAVFVGLCCEPVSGLTKWFSSPDAEPVSVFGRLPAVSPDGDRVALVGHDRVSVVSVDDPSGEGTEIALPADGLSVALDMMWLDGDRIALLVNKSGTLRLQEIVISEGTLRPGTELAIGSGIASALLVGVRGGELLVAERNEAEAITETFDAETFESLGTEPASTGLPYARRAGDRTMYVSDDGVLLMMGDGDVDPTTVGPGYSWAG